MARIALVLPNLSGGGAERVFLTLAEGFADVGIETEIVAARAEGPLVGDVPAGITLHDLGQPRVALSGPALARYLRAARPDAILGALTHMNVVAIAASRTARSRPRVVVTEHQHMGIGWGQGDRRRDRLLPRLAAVAYRHADTVVAVSREMARDLETRLRLPEPVETIYNPIPFAELRTRALGPAPHRWFEDGSPILVAAGRLTQQKGFDTLLDAMALLDGPARLIVFGDGPLRDMLEERTRQLGLLERVDLPGFIDNPYPALSRAAAFVSASRWEGLPTVLLEALALDTPVVATDCPTGPREILGGGRLGALVPPDDPGALADAITRTLANGSTVGAFDESPYRTEVVVAQYLRVLGITPQTAVSQS
jgi:glycosyltransferase involved in cell wall biosynthesis